MKIEGIHNIVFDIDIEIGNLYDVYVNEEICFRGISGMDLCRKLKNTDTIDMIVYQNGSDIYLFKGEAKGLKYCPYCGKELP